MMVSDNDSDDHDEVWSQPSDENLSATALIITLRAANIEWIKKMQRKKNDFRYFQEENLTLEKECMEYFSKYLWHKCYSSEI